MKKDMKVELIKDTESDLTTVNAARVSMNKHSNQFTYRKDKPKGSDEGLLEYLKKENHFTPFTHVRVTFMAKEDFLHMKSLTEEDLAGMVYSYDEDMVKIRTSLWGWASLLNNRKVVFIYKDSIINHLVSLYPENMKALGVEGGSASVWKVDLVDSEKETDPRFIDQTLRETVPFFVARQRFTHSVGKTYNEVSRRYVDEDPTYYYPEKWRLKPEGNIKQGSGEVHPENDEIKALYDTFIKIADGFYKHLIRKGVAPEMARMIFPMSTNTEYYVTGSQSAFKRSYDLRTDHHAQKEIRDLAEMWADILPEWKEGS